jgi:hypothetical protein
MDTNERPWDKGRTRFPSVIIRVYSCSFVDLIVSI